MESLRIIELSLGWGSQSKSTEIIDVILNKNVKYDIIVMTEFRLGNGYDEIITELRNKGYMYRYACYNESKDKRWSRVFIAIKEDMIGEIDAELATSDGVIPDKYINENENLSKYEAGWSRNWLGLTNLKGNKLNILGVHIPLYDKCPTYCERQKDKCEWKAGTFCRRYYLTFWNELKEYVKNHNNRTIIIGDFNGCRTPDDYDCPDKKNRLNEELIYLVDKKGWIDIWVSADKNKDKGERWTWHKKNRFRLDYAFAAPDMEGCMSTTSAKHLDEVRCKGISDHSALDIELDLSVL